MCADNLSSKDGDVLSEEMADFKPYFDQAIIGELENVASSNEVGQIRRVTLIVLTKGADDLSKIIISDPDVYATMIESVENFRDHAKALLEAAESASLRLTIAGCRQRAEKSH